MRALREFHHMTVFPAGAGVILKGQPNGIASISFPRRCGGDPPWIRSDAVFILFSPQVRG